uniref:Protein xylosyltransferase n=1 Tax=Alexandrium monilatum TaxID=311494 RepID=A0A7S4RT15_9DINO
MTLHRRQQGQSLGSLTLLVWSRLVDSTQQVPDLERAKDEMHDRNLVLEGDNKFWVKLPSPFFKPGDATPYPPRQDFTNPAVRKASRIVVLVASLSETKLANTLVTMFQRAAQPSRVFAGVVQQNRADEPDALEELCRHLGQPLELKEAFRGRKDLHMRQSDEDAWGHGRYTPASLAACEPAARVRMHRMDVSEAKGPAYARSQQPRLLGAAHAERDFCLQIDAHTVFVKGWDEDLIDEWAMTQNEYAVLTTYPLGADRRDFSPEKPINDQGRWAMPHLCKASFEAAGVVRNSIAGAVANLQSPVFTKFWAAGLSFSRCHAERDVPNDPGLTHIFSGEEFSRAARLWTNGYDMYSPMRPYVVTFYGDDKGGRGGWVTNARQKYQAQHRLSVLLGPRKEDRSALRGYDLGTRRTYEDYVKLSGIDMANQRVTDTPCSVTKWTPWEPGSQPPYEMLAESPARLGLGVVPLESPDLPGEREDAAPAGQGEPPPEVGHPLPPSGPQRRDSRFLQSPGFAHASADELQLAAVLALPGFALGCLFVRRCSQHRSGAKST